MIYGIAGFVYLAATAFRPAQAALLPSLAATPEELTAANVASSTIESVARFGGPALGGLLLAATSTRVVFAATVATFLWSALLVFGIRPPAAERETLPVQAALRDELLAGFRAIWTERRLRLLVSLFAAQTLVGGALNVLVVVVALRLLDLGNGGVGYLFSAVGIGGVLGAAAAVALIGRRRLAAAFGVGVVFWGTPIALVAVFPHTAAALILFAVIGLANTIVDVAGLTLLQRSVPGEVLGRVFGVLESIILATVALGAILAPVLVSGLGIRGALVAAGVFLPIVVALTWRPLAAMDADASPPAQELDLVRNLPLFAPLPGPVLEHLAASLVPVAAPAGTTVVRQGDSGDRFYVVAGGRLAVSVDGVPAGTLEQGDHFGEIALLRDVPRSATVTAEADAELLALERDEFIAAVTGHAASAEAADAVIATRLGSLRPSVASL
ncbi:MAG: cyclic nucleotide-binding domain-containing protein [Actinobacteria bacterium]|nr:MAG: cyclic nucleotide-binding domain-containing protein [Actinomycetota bacterium]